MLYHHRFRDSILIEPIRQGADKLNIISGYATHTMASWHMTEIASKTQKSIDIKLVIGMCLFDGISTSVHEGFKNIVSRKHIAGQSKITCQYVVEGVPVHSKMYLWEKSGKPFRSFMGSANYTQKAFSNSQCELLYECDPSEASRYFNLIEPQTMYCHHAEIEDKIRLTKTHPILEAENTPLNSIRGLGVESVKLSLLTRNNDVGFGSGLNWGHRRNGRKREPNQTYIPLPIAIAKTGFFPLEGKHFSVLTDDSIQLILRVEQANNKAITTPLNNSLIGEYIRNRIGVGNGTFVTKKNLEKYGRTDVTFYKLDDEQFFMDFSV